MLAYVMQYGFDITRLPLKAVLVVLAVPIGILFAISKLNSNASGKLKGVDIPLDAPRDTKRKPDRLFVVLVILYVGIYTNVVIRLYPREMSSFGRLRIFDALSPVEIFWTVAPPILLWWYRTRNKHKIDYKDN